MKKKLNYELIWLFHVCIDSKVDDGTTCWWKCFFFKNKLFSMNYVHVYFMTLFIMSYYACCILTYLSSTYSKYHSLRISNFLSEWWRKRRKKCGTNFLLINGRLCGSRRSFPIKICEDKFFLHMKCTYVTKFFAFQRYMLKRMIYDHK